MRRSRAAASAVAVLLCGTTGYAVLDTYDKVPGVLTLAASAQGRSSPSGSSTAAGSPTALPVAGSAAAMPLSVPGVTSPEPSRAALAAQLRGPLSDKRLGPSIGAVVRDAATQQELFGRGGTAPRTPASTTKLLTATAALHVLGAGARATTRVVTGRGSTPTVILVAGGDSLLASGRGNPNAIAGRAGLGDLAAQVATALHARGLHSVRLGLDDHAGAGPVYAPKWLVPDINAGFTGPVAMLGLTTRRAHSGHPAPSDPAMTAARAFARALRSAGVAVPGDPKRTRARAAATQLGAVTSAPVVDVLSAALAASDNALTETVARRAAVKAGVGTGFGTVAAFVLRTVHGLGIDTTGVRMVDSCGLSRGTAIPARVLSDVLDLAADGHDPALQEVVSRLPVAGLSGTLRSRFHLSSTRAAAGIARAKTGTLTGVSALAGTVVDRDGRLLTFVIMADKVPVSTGSPGARAAVDRFVAAVAGCGCRT